MTADRADEAPVTLTWVAVAGSLLGAFMAVLDIMIANASMPYIEGGIGTGPHAGPPDPWRRHCPCRQSPPAIPRPEL
jgi:hypothetical protein